MNQHISAMPLVIYLSYNHIDHHTWRYTDITQSYSRLYTIQNIRISFEHSPFDPEYIPNKYIRISFEQPPSDPECIPNKHIRISFEYSPFDPECILSIQYLSHSPSSTNGYNTKHHHSPPSLTPPITLSIHHPPFLTPTGSPTIPSSTHA